jgi:pimeloyl-ACP methyl ester carboxylesterase
MTNETRNYPAPASRTIEAAGHRMHYLTAGSGPPAVLLHGGASDARDWEGTMAALAPRHTLYAPDLVGYGRSERRESGYYFADFCQSILGFLEALGLEKVALVGHSFGGRVCLDIARHHPEMVSKMVLVDSAGFGKMAPWGNALYAGFWAARRLLRRRQPFPKYLTREGEGDIWTSAGELADIRTPTLIIWKRRDPYFPLSLAYRAAVRLPRARLVVLPGYGHAPPRQNSAEFNRLLQEFLDQDFEV